MLHDSDINASLGRAGIIFRGFADQSAPLLPPVLASMAANFSLDTKGFDSFSVESGDPRVRDKANAEWYRISSTGNLFDEASREFLVGVKIEENDGFGLWRWARAAIEDSWDVMGSGAAELLGNGPCLPGFIMMSLNGRTIVRGMVWETSIGAVAVRDPQDIPKFREFAIWQAESEL